MLPYIFIFDIDGTIIGDISHISREYVINKRINDISRHSEKSNYVIDFQKELKEGLLRPYFKEFIEYIKKKFNPCELFIYTRSSHAWTNGPLVSNIETALGTKFNKPYFTRENSIDNLKSLPEIFDSILKTLKSKKKYNNNTLYKYKDTILHERTIFIDDIPNNLTNMNNRQLVCPVYEFKPWRDIYANMLKHYGEDIISSKKVKQIFDDYYDKYIPYHNKNGSIEDRDELLFNLMKSMHIRICEIYKQEYKNDQYFKLLKDNLSDMTDKTISKINHSLNIS